LPITPSGFAVPYSRSLDRGLDERALLFDDDDFVEPAREVADYLGIERIDQQP